MQIGAVALAVHLVLPQLAGLEATGRALAEATWWSGGAVVAVEALSLVAYAELARTMLRGLGQPAPRQLVLRTTFASNGLARILPGGTATALAVVVDAFARAGIDPVRGATAQATSGALSSFTLALLLPAAALLDVAGGARGGVAVGGGWAAAAILGAALGIRPLLRRPELVGRLAARTASVLVRGPLRRRLRPAAVGATVERGMGRVAALLTDRGTLLRAGGWAAANWLLDLGALALVALVVGAGTPLTALPLAYVVAQLITAVPITPGGVGLVEAAMTATLVGSGAPAGAATATVLGWRLVNQWLAVGVGLAVLPTLSLRFRASSGP